MRPVPMLWYVSLFLGLDGPVGFVNQKNIFYKKKQRRPPVGFVPPLFPLYYNFGGFHVSTSLFLKVPGAFTYLDAR
jgi:hypothetical protein